LGIKVAQSNNGIVISQRKYALDILKEIGLINSKFVDTPMDPNVKLLLSQDEPRIDYIYNKLGTYDLYALDWGRMLNVTGLTHIFCYSVTISTYK